MGVSRKFTNRFIVLVHPQALLTVTYNLLTAAPTTPDYGMKSPAGFLKTDRKSPANLLEVTHDLPSSLTSRV